MPDGPSVQSIFISHTHTDQAIAHAIRNAVQSLFGDAVAVRYSTNKELDGGIKPGEDWFRWIGQQVREEGRADPAHPRLGAEALGPVGSRRGGRRRPGQ